MKFHTDENVPEAVALGLRRRGIDVTTSQEAGLLGKSDEEQLEFAHTANRVIVSHDSDMLRLAMRGISHAGVAYCHIQKYNIGQLVQKLMALATLISPQPMTGRVEFL